MNDPLYNHPAWKVGGAGGACDSVDVDRVISEIVKSNYTSKSGDQALAKDDIIGESEAKDHPPSPKASTQSEMSKAITESLSEKANNDSRTTKCKGDSASEETVPEVDEASNSEKPLLTTLPKAKSPVHVSEPGVQVGETANERVREVHEEKCLGDGTENKTEQSQERVVEESDLQEQCTETAAGSSECVSYDPDCTECKTVHPDPTPSELMMYLHALSYKVQ